MFSIASTLIHPDRVSLASASPVTGLIRSVRMTSASVVSSAGNRISKRKTTRVRRRVRGNAGLKSSGEVVL